MKKKVFLALISIFAYFPHIHAMSIHKAIKENDVYALKKIIAHAKIQGTLEYILNDTQFVGKSRRRFFLFSPLHHAIYEKNLPIIKILIEYGADINRKNLSYRSALFAILKNYRDKEIIEYLLSQESIEISTLDFYSALLLSLTDRSQKSSEYPIIQTLQKFLSPKRLSFETLKFFKASLEPYNRYEGFNKNILYPTGFEDFIGFNKQQLLEVGVPWMLSKQRLDYCNYDINFYFNNKN